MITYIKIKIKELFIHIINNLMQRTCKIKIERDQITVHRQARTSPQKHIYRNNNTGLRRWDNDTIYVLITDSNLRGFKINENIFLLRLLNAFFRNIGICITFIFIFKMSFNSFKCSVKLFIIQKLWKSFFYVIQTTFY